MTESKTTGKKAADKKKRVRWFWEKDSDESRQGDDMFSEIVKPFGFDASMKMPKHTIGMNVPINVSETDKNLIIRAELSGFRKSEINLTVTPNTFELSAEKKHEEIERGETFYRKQIGHKSVHRAFTLPVAVDADGVSAKLEEGVLIVTMPKLEVEKKKKKAVEIA